MSRLSVFVAFSLLAVACGGPLEVEEPDELSGSVASELSAAAYVRITGTCFQSYEMTSINTGNKLGAAKLVFKPGHESKQAVFCAGTDRVLLYGSKTSDGNFAVEYVWIQQSGGRVDQNVEFVRGLKQATGDTFERALNATKVSAVKFQLGTNALSQTSTDQFGKGRIIFAGPRSNSSSSGGYGQSSSSSGTRRVDAVFQEL